MTDHDLDILDTIGTSDYIPGELSDTGQHQTKFTFLTPTSPHDIEVDIPLHMVPPNPDDSDGVYI